MLVFSHQGGMSGRQKADDCHEKALPLAPRNGGSKGDPKVPEKYRSPHQKNPLPASCKRDLTSQFQNSDMQMQSTALLALQEATKYFMVDVLSNTNLCANHANQVTIQRKDLALACRIRGIKMGRA
jgi:histone H3/H4